MTRSMTSHVRLDSSGSGGAAEPEGTAGRTPGLEAFWTIWSGQALSLVGSQVSQFALIWWLTLETGSPGVLSMATLLALLPTVLLGPLVGALVDRWSRARTMIIADGAVALGSLVLMVLFLSGRATPGAVLAFILWRAIGGAFHAPAMMAATSLMVPVEKLARVQGINHMLQGGLGIFTAPLGALLLGVVGMAGAMAMDVLTAFCAIVPLLFVPVPEPAKEAPGIVPGPLLREIAAGFSYLRALPGPMAIIGFASVVNLFLVPAFALLPLLVLQELRGDASHQAWLGSAVSVGVIAGGLALGTLASSRSRVRTALGSLVGLGLATIVLGGAPAGFFPAAVAAILAIGAFSAIANGSFAVLLQATIAPEYQGRVFTLMMSVAGAMTPIGLLLATPLAELAGVRAWYIAGGFVCAAMGTAAFLVRSIVRMEVGAAARPTIRVNGSQIRARAAAPPV